MKIVIDIPEERYNYLVQTVKESINIPCESLPMEIEIIANGTPLDYLTNGQVAKEIFGLHSNALSWNIRTQQWWNAPFKKMESD